VRDLSRAYRLPLGSLVLEDGGPELERENFKLLGRQNFDVRALFGSFFECSPQDLFLLLLFPVTVVVPMVLMGAGIVTQTVSASQDVPVCRRSRPNVASTASAMCHAVHLPPPGRAGSPRPLPLSRYAGKNYPSAPGLPRRSGEASPPTSRNFASSVDWSSRTAFSRDPAHATRAASPWTR